MYFKGFGKVPAYLARIRRERELEAASQIDGESEIRNGHNVQPPVSE